MSRNGGITFHAHLQNMLSQQILLTVCYLDCHFCNSCNLVLKFYYETTLHLYNFEVNNFLQNLFFYKLEIAINIFPRWCSYYWKITFYSQKALLKYVFVILFQRSYDQLDYYWMNHFLLMIRALF